LKKLEPDATALLRLIPDTGPHAMVRLLSRVIGIGIETADSHCARRRR